MIFINSCTAFDTSHPSKKGKTIQCLLYGHSDVHPASAVPGTCFKMPTVKPPHKKVVAEQAAAGSRFEDTKDLGKGLCRGQGWQDGEQWPKDKGRRTLKECHVGCKQTRGCTAFDISHLDKAGKKANCFLFGHVDVQPASGLEGRCYKMLEVKSAGKVDGIYLAPNEVRLGDEAIARKLEHGCCRGSGWQNGIWPVDAGTLTRKGCAEACVRTSGE
jgi:hypothetical protein